MSCSIRILLGAVLTVACLTPTASTQDLQLDEGAVGSYLRLKELQNNGSVLHVVAHPDDEDGAMLAYSARGLGARTMLFSITRGEGGANKISSHFFDELGALRTLEHLKAASYYGIELFYSRAADYGYSKTLEEAMRQWKHGVPILEDLVEVIRRERPTVMLSRFAGDPLDGHGHHQMAGVVSRQAFEAAADPTKFPEQIERGLQPWQVKKLYTRAGSPWRQPKEGDWTIALPTGTHDPVIGRSYAQVSRFGLGFQRSQGITGHDGDPGPRSSYYRLLKWAGKTELPMQESSLFDGLDMSLPNFIAGESRLLPERRKQFEQIEADLQNAYTDWNPRSPEKTVERLQKQSEELRGLQFAEILVADSSAAAKKNAQANIDRLDEKIRRAIVTAAGIRFDAWATDLEGDEINHAVEGELKLHLRIFNPGPLPLKTSDLRISSPMMDQGIVDFESTNVSPGDAFETSVTVLAPGKPTTPHWSRDSIAKPLYDVRPDGQQLPAPESPFNATWSVILNDAAIDLRATVQTKLQHPEYGRVSYPLTTAPAMSVNFASDSTIVIPGQATFPLSVVVRNCINKANATARLQLPSGWTATPAEHRLRFERADEERTVVFQIAVPSDAKQQEYSASAVVESFGKEYQTGFETVSAPDLGRMNVYHDATHRIQIADVKLAGTPSVGYITGSGDKVAESLAPLGITPTVLSEADLASGDLSRFDVILVGVRAYAVREDIRTHNSRLLEFAKRGGTLIVQYQTPEFDENYGPYPYSMPRPEEVSEEDAVVTILEPNHPLFTSPNKITAADFDNWFEQRGSKFWKTWDERYTALLECHDTGQAPQKGGMLITKYGNGHYVYSAYAWYRQLPNGVPGAYRLFANMLSLPVTGNH